MSQHVFKDIVPKSRYVSGRGAREGSRALRMSWDFWTSLRDSYGIPRKILENQLFWAVLPPRFPRPGRCMTPAWRPVQSSLFLNLALR